MSVEPVSALALIVSIGSFIFSYVQNRALAKENAQLQKGAFYRERNFDFESRLAEWPDAYEFFGIDLQQAKEKTGVSEQHITYLILSIHALSSYCRIEGESIYEHLMSNDYRQRMFSHKKTRDAWIYARELFSDYIRKGIDKYLSEQYPNEW